MLLSLNLHSTRHRCQPAVSLKHACAAQTQTTNTTYRSMMPFFTLLLLPLVYAASPIPPPPSSINWTISDILLNILPPDSDLGGTTLHFYLHNNLTNYTCLCFRRGQLRGQCFWAAGGSDREYEETITSFSFDEFEDGTGGRVEIEQTWPWFYENRSDNGEGDW